MPPLLQHDENRQLKTTQGHLMHCSHICIMDLPALQGLFHFCMGVDSPTCRQAHAGTGMDLSTWTDPRGQCAGPRPSSLWAI